MSDHSRYLSIQHIYSRHELQEYCEDIHSLICCTHFHFLTIYILKDVFPCNPYLYTLHAPDSLCKFVLDESICIFICICNNLYYSIYTFSLLYFFHLDQYHSPHFQMFLLADCYKYLYLSAPLSPC